MSTVVLIGIFLSYAIFVIWRFKKGNWEKEKELWTLLGFVLSVALGLFQFEIKYEAIRNIETNMNTIQKNITTDKNNISKMETNILSVEKHISEMETNILKVEENVKNIAKATTGISREGGRTIIKDGLTIQKTLE